MGRRRLDDGETREPGGAGERVPTPYPWCLPSLGVLGERSPIRSVSSGHEFTRNALIDIAGDTAAQCLPRALPARRAQDGSRGHLPQTSLAWSVSCSANINALIDGRRMGKVLSPSL